MDNINKNLGQWASNGAYVDTVPAGKLEDGFVPGETPFAQFLNKPLSENYSINKYTERLLSGVLPKGIYDGLFIHHEGLGVFSLYSEAHAIASLSSGGRFFRIDGVDLSDEIHARDTIEVKGTTASDGVYTVEASSYIAVTQQSFITVVENIASGTVGSGKLYTGGSIVTSEGIRYLAAPQLNFDTASLPGVGSYRYDYIIAYWDNTTNTFTFGIDDAGTGHTLVGNEYLVGAYYCYNNAGTFEVKKITNGSRRFDSSQIYYVGDGVNSFDSEDFEITDRINNAITLANANGGGEVRVVGDGWQELPNLTNPSYVVKMQSNVTLNFQGSNFTTSDSNIPNNITITGGSEVITTNAGTNTITSSSLKFDEMGIGTRVNLSAGTDTGNFIVIGIIDTNNIEVAQPTNTGWILPSFVGGTSTGIFYLSKAIVKNLTYDGRQNGIEVGYTSDCGLSNVVLINSDSTTPTSNAIVGTGINIRFTLDNINEDTYGGGIFTNSINFSASTNSNCRVSFCHLNGAVNLAGTGLYIGNKTTGSVTLANGWLNPIPNAHLKNNEKMYFGNSLDASMYHDGTYLIFDPRENSLSGHSKFLNGDIRIEAGNLVLDDVNLKAVFNNDFYAYSNGTDMIFKSVAPGAIPVKMQADLEMENNSTTASDLVGCNNNAAGSSTKGFVYLPTLATQPSGVAANFGTRIAMAMDNAQKKWHYVGAGKGTVNNWRSRVDIPVSGRWVAAGTELAADITVVPVIWQGTTFWDEPGTNRMDTSTGEFLADVAMKVQVNSLLTFDTSTAWATGDYCVLKIQKNTGSGWGDWSTIGYNQMSATPAGTHIIVVNGSDIVRMNSGDKIRITIYQNSGSNLTINSDSYLSISEI